MKRVSDFSLLLLLLSMCGSGFAGGACTYNEAIMALERGNTVRGMALMRMAQRDGDERAVQFLAQKDHPIGNIPVASVQKDNSQISLSQASPQ